MRSKLRSGNVACMVHSAIVRIAMQNSRQKEMVMNENKESGVPAQGLTGKPIAYAVYGIGGGKIHLHNVKPIKDDEWKIDDDCLGDYWSGNEALYAAVPAQREPAGDDECIIRLLRQIATDFAIDHKTNCKQHICWLAAERLTALRAIPAEIPTTKGMQELAEELFSRLCHECYAVVPAKCNCIEDIRAKMKRLEETKCMRSGQMSEALLYGLHGAVERYLAAIDAVRLSQPENDKEPK